MADSSSSAGVVRTGAIMVERPGPSAGMRWKHVALPAPGRGEVLVRHTAIGVNFYDILTRSRSSPETAPFGLGVDAVGRIVAVGPGTLEIHPGQRAAYAGLTGGAVGAYSEYRVVPADRLIPVPESLDDVTVAATLMKGMTVRYLFHDVAKLCPKEVVLFHAAAGGVGLLAGQWARSAGVTAIGTAGGAQKCAIALEHGYDNVIDYRHEDFAAKTRALTGGAGVRVVFDSVGRDTFTGSLRSLRRRGLLVCFGSASGPVPPITIDELARWGSIAVTRPTLADFTADRASLLAVAGDYLSRLASRALRVAHVSTFPLAEAARAHDAIESREVIGAVALLP